MKWKIKSLFRNCVLAFIILEILFYLLLGYALIFWSGFDTRRLTYFVIYILCLLTTFYIPIKYRHTNMLWFGLHPLILEGIFNLNTFCLELVDAKTFENICTSILPFILINLVQVCILLMRKK